MAIKMSALVPAAEKDALNNGGVCFYEGSESSIPS